MSTPARRWFRRLVLWPLLVVVLIVLYYGVGGHIAQSIDDDPGFAAAVEAPEAGSATVAVMAALLAREVDQNGWVANDPVVFPTHMLDDMANYQKAMVRAIRALLADLGTWTAGDAPDPLLEEAAGALAVPEDRWTFDLAKSWRPQTTTEQFYRDAVRALERFNAEVALGRIALAPSADALPTTLERMAAELDAAAAANLEHVRAHGGEWLDDDVDDLFMATKGQLYADHALLSGLERDFAEPIAAGGAGALAAEASEALARAMALGPWLVMNGSADGQFRPSHLTAQAAHVERAAQALRRLAASMAGPAA